MQLIIELIKQFHWNHHNMSLIDSLLNVLQCPSLLFSVERVYLSLLREMFLKSVVSSTRNSWILLLTIYMNPTDDVSLQTVHSDVDAQGWVCEGGRIPGRRLRRGTTEDYPATLYQGKYPNIRYALRSLPKAGRSDLPTSFQWWQYYFLATTMM